MKRRVEVGAYYQFNLEKVCLAAGWDGEGHRIPPAAWQDVEKYLDVTFPRPLFCGVAEAHLKQTEPTTRGPSQPLRRVHANRVCVRWEPVAEFDGEA